MRSKASRGEIDRSPARRGVAPTFALLEPGRRGPRTPRFADRRRAHSSSSGSIRAASWRDPHRAFGRGAQPHPGRGRSARASPTSTGSAATSPTSSAGARFPEIRESAASHGSRGARRLRSAGRGRPSSWATADARGRDRSRSEVFVDGASNLLESGRSSPTRKRSRRSDAGAGAQTHADRPAGPVLDDEGVQVVIGEEPLGRPGPAARWSPRPTGRRGG